MDNVILGMPGNWASNYCEPADIYTTKIGGLPDWPFPNASEKIDLLHCVTCGNELSLLAQVYAPLTNKSSEIERAIYVFCCLVPDCKSLSWRALRVQKISSKVVPEVLKKMGIDIEEDVDPIENDDINLEQLMMQFSEVTKVSSTSKRQNKDRKSRKKRQSIRSINDNSLVIRCFYIYPAEERLFTSKSSNSASPSLQKLKKNPEDSLDGETFEEEKYEHAKALSADRTYLKFKKRMDECPDQCLRYSYCGKPLLASADVGDPGMCQLCGGARQYEMQLMPPVLHFIQTESNEERKASLEKLDWMTLLVYTCSKNCTASSLNFVGGGWMVSEEAALPQYELGLGMVASQIRDGIRQFQADADSTVSETRSRKK